MRRSRGGRPPDRTRQLLPAPRARGRAHARRLDDDLRGPRSPLRRVPGPHRARACTWSRASVSACASCRSGRGGPSGSTTPISTSPTTCATPRCRRPAPSSSCARSRLGSSPRSSTARSRSGRCGWSRAWREGASRSSARATTAWWTASRALTSPRVLFDLEPDPDRSAASASAEWLPRPRAQPGPAPGRGAARAHPEPERGRSRRSRGCCEARAAPQRD